MRNKRFFAGLLTAAMVLGVSGFSAMTAEADDAVTLKWITIGNGMPQNYASWQETLNDYLEEKIGVNVDIEVVAWGDWDNRRSVIVNSGEYFDILFTDQARYSTEVSTGALLDITELVKTDAPDLYAMIPEIYWDALRVDGSFYGVPTYKDSSTTEYFIWDADMADQYGIDITEVTDFDELYEALKLIHDGEGGMQYYMSRAGADFIVTAYYDQLGCGLPCLGIRFDDGTYTVVNPMEDEEILSRLDVVYQMYEDGIINGDAPIAEDSNSYRVFSTAQGWSAAASTVWGQNWGIENCVAVQYGDTVVSNNSVRGSINAIYSGCKYPDKALQLLELVNTDTYVRDLLYYGEEGVNFVYTDDGKVDQLNTDWSMAGYTQGTFFAVSQLASMDYNQWDEVRELNEQAVPSVMLGFEMDTSSLETEIASCTAVYEKYKSEFYTGAQNPRELLGTVLNELDAAGWETIRESAQEQVDAWLAEQS